MGGCGCLASTNVLEDRGDDIGIFDAGDDAQFAAALGAGLDVDGEDAFQALRPGHGGKGLIRLFVARFAFCHDGLTMLANRREHAVEPGEVQSRMRDQRRRAGDEVEWVEDDAGGAVAKRLLEPIDDLSPIVGREPLVGDGGPRDVATELFELVALGGFTDGGGVERKARLPGEQGGWEGFGPYRDGARGQCLPVGDGPDGDPVVDYDGIGDTIRVSLSDDPTEKIYTGIEILKSLELRKEGTVLVACPSCGRADVDVVKLANSVDDMIKKIKTPLKVAVMGCEVNGPGEAKDADVGIAAGAGRAIAICDVRVQNYATIRVHNYRDDHMGLPTSFSVRDLRQRSAELLRNAEDGRLAIITKHGRPTILAVPFDDRLLDVGVHRSLALQLFEQRQLTLSQAAKVADLSAEDFMDLLGKAGVAAVDYPPSELEDELHNAL